MRHFEELPSGLVETVVNKLSALDEAAPERRCVVAPAPGWRSKVMPGSERVMDNGKLREARRFRSSLGRSLLFEWHARYGDGGRIHLRFDVKRREVEIGYIGHHLPLR